jgi:hypothetical protein
MSLTIMVVSPIMASVGFDGQSWWALMVSPCIASIGQFLLKSTNPAIISDSDPDQLMGFDG